RGHDAGIDIAVLERRGASALLAERHGEDALEPPALPATELAHHPIGAGARGGDADALALEISGALQRRIGPSRDHEAVGRSGDDRDGDRRHALDAIGHAGAGAEADLDLAGGERLLDLRIAAEGRRLDLEPVFLPDAGLVADLDAGKADRRAGARDM